jgi:hypothetical protein
MNPELDTIKCTYNPNIPAHLQENPHTKLVFNPINPKIYDDYAQIIGNTPMLR